MHCRSSSSSFDGQMEISADANPLASQDEAASGQHDPDSITTHVTETQFTQGANLEIDALSELANDEHHDLHMNGSTNSQSMVHESVAPGTDPSPPTNAQSVHHVVKHVGRLEVEKEEHPCAFTFAQAPKATLNLARRIGPSQPQASHEHSAAAEKAMPIGSVLVPDKEQTKSKVLVLSQNKTMESTRAQGHEYGQCGLQKHHESGRIPLSTRVIQETITPVIPSLQNMGTDPGQGKPKAIIDLTAELPSMQHVTLDGHEQNHVAPSNRNHEVLRVWGGPSQIHLEERSSSHTANDSRQFQQNLHLQEPSAHDSQSHPAIRIGSTNSVEAPEMPWTPSKVTKTRKKPKGSRMLQNSATQAQPNTPGSEPSPEDLLTILLFRARQDKKARDLARAVQQAKEAELEDITQAYTKLRAQMQELSQREKAQQAELVKYHKALPAWKIKLRRLEDYVTGLTNDHNNLRDDASIIRRQQQSLKTDSAEITASVKKALDNFGRTSGNTTKILIGAKQDIYSLERRVEEQNTRHQENMDRLEVERARNNKLEHDISGIAVSQQQIDGLLRTQRQAIIEKLDELFSKPLATESIPSDFQKHTWDMLDRVLGLLTEIKAMDKANPEQLLRIDETITGFAGQLGDSLQQLIGASKSSQSVQLKLKRNMHRQMEDLRVHIVKEQSLAVQVTDLRESKAALAERLQGNETALAETRQVMVSLQAREQSLSDQVAGLKAELLEVRERSTETQAIKSQLRQSEICNSELEAEVARLSSSFSAQVSLLEQSNTKVTALQDTIRSLEAQLNEGKTRASKLEEEKAACDVQANAKYESLRSQLLTAANVERKFFVDEQSTILLQLQLKKAASESKAKKLEEEVENSIQIHSDMEVFQAQLRENDRQLVATREMLRLREEDLQSKCAENEALKEDELNHARNLAEVESRLALVIAESKSRDDERIGKIKEAGQTLNQNMNEYTSFDDALDAVLEMLVESAKPQPATAMLNEIESQELPYGQASLSQSARTPVAEPESQELPYSRRHSVSTPKQVSDEIDACDRCPSQRAQGVMAVQELEIEETTYRRNITTTRSTRGIDGASMYNASPSRGSKYSFSRFEGRPHQSGSESPMLDTTGLFPPTPVPFSKNDEARVGMSTPGMAPVLSCNGVNSSCTKRESSVSRSTYSMPRSILKPPRPGKRRLSGSFLWSPVPPSPKRSASTVERQGLGPIIPESQNSSQGVEKKANIKARKSTRRGTDKFTRRFNNAG